jgi:hypothetical protein
MRMKSMAVGFAVFGVIATGCSGSGSGARSGLATVATPASNSPGTQTPARDLGDNLARCTGFAVTAVVRPTGHVANMHEHPYVIRFRNRSRHGCVLRGYPAVRLVRSHAPRSWRRVVPSSTFPYPPVVAGVVSTLRVASVVIEPRSSAFAYLAIVSGATCGVTDAADLRVGISRGSEALMRRVNVAVCQGNDIDLSPFTSHRA